MVLNSGWNLVSLKGHGIALRHRIHMLGEPNMLGEPL